MLWARVLLQREKVGFIENTAMRHSRIHDEFITQRIRIMTKKKAGNVPPLFPWFP